MINFVDTNMKKDIPLNSTYILLVRHLFDIIIE